MKKQLDPKAVWLFFLSFLSRWIVLIFFASVWLSAIFSGTKDDGGELSLGFLNWLWIVIPTFFIIGFFWAKLSYRFYNYELTDDGFRKEHGVIWKKYTTIPYDRIQNVDIYRGVMARMLGLSDLRIQTAGSNSQYAGYGAGDAEGSLPGLSREAAEQLRDELIRRAKSSKNQGL